MFYVLSSRSRVRPRLLLVLAGAAVALAVALAGPAGAGAATPRARAHDSSACPWVNSQAPIAKRVADVIDHMSLDDQITMVEGHGTAPPNPYVFYMPGIPDLCIPQLGEEDGPAGVADQLTGVTQLPAGVGLAASFNPSLARQYGQVIGSEEFGKGAAVNLGPTVNIDRDPRWGRSFETFTEDPFLNSALTVSEIKGVQGTGEMSQVKHFAAYNQETNRNTPADNVIASTRTLREIYEPAFQAAVENAKVASLMCSYSTINGDFACQNNDLLNTTLKQLWGFPGFVTSDYAALHSTDGAVAGTDQEQPFNDFFGAALKQEVQNGTVPRAVLNTMVSRMLTEMFRFGLIDHPPTGTPSDPVTTPAHVAVATNVADQSATLLKNDGNTLPLSAQPRRHRGGDRAVGVGVPDVRGRRKRLRDPVADGVAAAGPRGSRRTWHPPALPAGPADRRVAAGDPVLGAVACLCPDPVRRQLQRNADRAGDRHLRARHREPVRLLHADVPVAQRPADPRRPEHAAGEHLLGGGGPRGRADVLAEHQR